MMKKVTKAVIPAAGLGTRVLPATKAMPKDYKTRLQEASQQLYGEAPLYTRLGSRGPEHAKVFEIGLKLPNGKEFVATGSSCKKAEQNAAQQALAMLEETKNNQK